MKNKTCGECKHFYTSDEGQCSLKDDWGFTDSDACPDFKSKIATNGDVIRQMSNERLAGFISSRVECLGGVLGLAKCWEIWLNAPAEIKTESVARDEKSM